MHARRCELDQGISLFLGKKEEELEKEIYTLKREVIVFFFGKIREVIVINLEVDKTLKTDSIK